MSGAFSGDFGGRLRRLLGRVLLQRLAGRGRGAALRAGADGFDFAAIFLDFATALAMASNYPERGEKMRALHHFEGFRASRETPLSRARTVDT